MYGVYAWQAGATGQQVVADLVAMIAGAAVADLSGVCDKALSSVAGAASGWSVVDAAFGVLGAASQEGGPQRQARLMSSDTPRVVMAAVHAWATATHTTDAATNALEASGVVGDAGAVNVIATPGGLLIGASDWSLWAMHAEVKRAAPPLSGALPGSVVVNGYGYAYVPKAKNPEGLGLVVNASAAVVSSYAGLAETAARDALDMLYIPLVPACVAVKQVPFGELSGVLAAGGYAASGDLMTAGADTWVAAKTNAGLRLAIKRV